WNDSPAPPEPPCPRSPDLAAAFLPAALASGAFSVYKGDYGRGTSRRSSKKTVRPAFRPSRVRAPNRTMATPRVLILRAPGANRDVDAEFAFQSAGANAERVHINRLREKPNLLHRYQILTVPGGFTYGDDVAAGKILANQLAHFLGDELRKFRNS